MRKSFSFIVFFFSCPSNKIPDLNYWFLLETFSNAIDRQHHLQVPALTSEAYVFFFMGSGHENGLSSKQMTLKDFLWISLAISFICFLFFRNDHSRTKVNSYYALVISKNNFKHAKNLDRVRKRSQAQPYWVSIRNYFFCIQWHLE